MFCQNCGQKVEDRSNFCCQCGQGVASTSGTYSTDSSGNSNSTVDYLKKKYGIGQTFEETCPDCGTIKEITSSGVHESASGSLRVYADEETFVCPKCPIKHSAENPVQQPSHNKPTSVKSFASYKEFKGRQWRNKGKGKQPASEKKVNKAVDVAISIGLMEYKEKSLCLKPARGKRILLRVSNMATYGEVRGQAVEKWKAYQSNCYSEGKDYLLLLENGKEARFLPGSTEHFSLKRYQEETGKDFKRIVLYLCTVDDLKMVEEQEFEQKEEESSDDSQNGLPGGKRAKLRCENDEIVAKKLQQQYDHEIEDNNYQQFDKLASVSQVDEAFFADSFQSQIDFQAQVSVYQETEGFQSVSRKGSLTNDLVDEPARYESCSRLTLDLARGVKTEEEFLVVIRRGASLERILKIWQREAKRKSPENKLKVHFTGEEGCDTGALAKEFLTTVLREIGEKIFPGGTPIDSMLNIQSETFLTCGQIVAVSIAQGGPPFPVLEECVFEMLLNTDDVDLNDLSCANHLTDGEKAMLESIKADPTLYLDKIIEHGYTGVIDQEHITAITGTILVSLVSKRLLYLKEFLKGLQLYGFSRILKSNPSLCKELFVKGKDNAVDANYLVSILKPVYSEVGSSHKVLEERLLDNLQDFIISLEDEKLSGQTEILGNNEEQDDDTSPEIPSKELTADLTPSGLLGWLTGQKHKPLNGQLSVTVQFDHNCMERNPKHLVCFPTVSACARTITLPVAHMKESEDFNKTMLLALCKGQVFSME